MGIIRELVTLFTFETKDAGLKEYNEKVKSSVELAKKTIETVGLALGASLAIGSIASFVDGLADSIKHAKRLNIQMSQIITPDLDSDKIMQGLFELAQETGDVYTEVAENFKGIAISAKEFGVSQVTALEATRNIAKAIEVGRLNEEDATRARETLNMAFKRGVLPARTFAELSQTAPKIVEVLGQALGKTAAELREMAKDGDLTGEVLIKNFAKTNEALNEAFELKPETMGEAFNYVYNYLVKIGTIFSKTGRTVDRIARGIERFADKVVAAGKQIVDALGGVDNVLSLVEAAFYAAFGYVTIGLIVNAIKWVEALGQAAAIASLKFLAIAAGVAAVVLAIEDIMVWMRGGDSLAGRLLGPFSELEGKLGNFIKPFQGIKKIFEGDFKGAFTDLLAGMSDVKGWMGTLITTAGLVVVAIKAWNLISFVGGLIAALGNVIAKVFEVTAATEGAKAAMITMDTFTFGSLILSISAILVPIALVAGAIHNLLEENRQLQEDIKKTTDAYKEFDEAKNPKPTVKQLQEKTGIKEEQEQLKAGIGAGRIKIGPADDKFQAARRSLKNFLGPLGIYMDTVPEVSDDKRIDLYDALGLKKPVSAPQQLTNVLPADRANKQNPFAAPVDAQPQQPQDNAGWFARQWANLPTWMGGGGAAPNAPGAIANAQPPAPVTVIPPPNEIKIENNINVTATAELSELGPTIAGKVAEGMNKVVTTITNKLNQASTQTEAATQ
jgi:tape measure domain-containing protein